MSQGGKRPNPTQRIPSRAGRPRSGAPRPTSRPRRARAIRSVSGNPFRIRDLPWREGVPPSNWAGGFWEGLWWMGFSLGEGGSVPGGIVRGRDALAPGHCSVRRSRRGRGSRSVSGKCLGGREVHRRATRPRRDPSIQFEGKMPKHALDSISWKYYGSFQRFGSEAKLEIARIGSNLPLTTRLGIGIVRRVNKLPAQELSLRPQDLRLLLPA